MQLALEYILSVMLFNFMTIEIHLDRCSFCVIDDCYATSNLMIFISKYLKVCRGQHQIS